MLPIRLWGCCVHCCVQYREFVRVGQRSRPTEPAAVREGHACGGGADPTSPTSAWVRGVAENTNGVLGWAKHAPPRVHHYKATPPTPTASLGAKTRTHTAHHTPHTRRHVCTARGQRLAKKSGTICWVGIFIDFVWLTKRTPHGAYVRRAKRTRIDRHEGGIERLTYRSRAPRCGTWSSRPASAPAREKERWNISGGYFS